MNNMNLEDCWKGNWDGFRYFLAAVKASSLSGAADILGANQSTVGRQIDALEKTLGVKLFQRSVKGLELTEDGWLVYEQSQSMFDSVQTVWQVTQGNAASARGDVRLSLPEGLGQEVLMPLLNDFYQAFPEITLIFNMSATTANISHSDADISVCLFKPEDPALHVQCVGEMKLGLYASESFKQQYGVPASLKELRQFKVVTYGDQLTILEENQWLLNHSSETLRVLRSDSTVTRFKATLAGVGIAVQPVVLANTNSSFIRLFKGVKLPAHQVWLVHQKAFRKIPRIAAVSDFIMTRLSQLLAE